jgi:hypothetical protein
MAQAPLNSQAIELSGGHANRAHQNLAFSGAHVYPAPWHVACCSRFLVGGQGAKHAENFARQVEDDFDREQDLTGGEM